MNEIKKILYKEAPIAHFTMIRKGVAYYRAETSIGEIRFEVPVEDMGDADFLPQMEAKLLIRYAVVV